MSRYKNAYEEVLVKREPFYLESPEDIDKMLRELGKARWNVIVEVPSKLIFYGRLSITETSYIVSQSIGQLVEFTVEDIGRVERGEDKVMRIILRGL